ncbi:hypothetical protein [Psychrobacter sp. GP33]|uniref:hypothetical protein n=1 Tax=Psychrobacter sp. GP33 TaxID=2758709 RepID=UPI0015F94CC3|nr:hypothetical protein [Psychrobacter sp. GP33]
MAKRLINMLIISAAGVWMLSGCNNADNANSTAQQDSAQAETQPAASATDSAPTAIDWTRIDSSEKAANRDNYQYPFALDSQNVRDYAGYFKVDNATAQHNLTISMASNEALSKVLDQLSTSYVSHGLTDTKDMTLIIHTTPDIAASSYDYVLAGDFAKGLILPIVIQPDGKESDVKGHGEVQK